MIFIRRHWYDLGLALAIATLVWQAFARFESVQLILLLNLVVIFLHQFEEYRLPGGEPWILNEVFQPRGGPADRYPLNQNNAAFINIMAWPFYFIPILVPETVWVGLAPVLFGFGQFVVHGIINNRQLKTWYNPGLAAVVLGHVPLGIWYLIEVYNQGLVHWWDWAFAVLYMLFFMGFIMMFLGYRIMVDKNSPYPFTPEEMNKFDRLRRLAHAGISPLPLTESGADDARRA